MAHFSASFKDSVLYNLDGGDVTDADVLITLFNSTCTNILDSVAPLRMKRTKALSEPWLNDTTRAIRCACQQAERRWKKDKLRVSYEILQQYLSDYQRAVKLAKSDFISKLVANNHHRPEVLFNMFNIITNPHNSVPITPTLDLCNSFLEFFVEKIFALRSSVTTSCDHDPSVPPLCLGVLHQFEPISIFSLSEVVHHLRPTNCPSDSIPSRFIREVFDTVGPCILSLINTCLVSGHVPSAFKHAVVQPLLIKKNLNPSVLSNFRPISKLSFLSKVLEKVVSMQLQTFLINNNVYEIPSI